MPSEIERIIDEGGKDSMIVTINDDLTVRLNARGRKIWEASGLSKNKPVGEDGLLTCKIWIIMMVFGPSVAGAFELPFDTTMVVSGRSLGADKLHD